MACARTSPALEGKMSASPGDSLRDVMRAAGRALLPASLLWRAKPGLREIVFTSAQNISEGREVEKGKRRAGEKVWEQTRKVNT